MRVLHATPPAPPVVEVVPDPAPGTGEVLLRVLASSVNPVDVQTAAGMYHDLGWIAQDTVGVGWDGVGEVVAMGDGVADVAVGSTVAIMHHAVTRGTGTHAELVAVQAADVAAVPDGLEAAEAATVPLNSLTAAQALDLFGAERGSLLVTGAAGGVGGFALPLAVRAGFEVTGLARESDRDFVERAGARLVTGPEGAYDAVLDAAALGSTAVAAVRDGGRYVGVMPPAVPDPERGVSTQAVSVEPDGARLARLLELAADGVLAPRVAEVRPLTDGPAVLTEPARGLRGRVVLVP